MAWWYSSEVISQKIVKHNFQGVQNIAVGNWNIADQMLGPQMRINLEWISY